MGDDDPAFDRAWSPDLIKHFGLIERLKKSFLSGEVRRMIARLGDVLLRHILFSKYFDYRSSRDLGMR